MQTGMQIDQYTIQQLLGSGGMADVYLAWDTTSQWPVALKLMNATAMSSTQLQERFKREVSVAMKLRHPHVVQVYGWGQIADGRYYLVMEYINGGNLSGLIDQYVSTGRAVPDQQAAYLLRRVAGAMAYTHEQGIIHRDLKPSNILLRSENGEPVVTDLGIASVAGANPLTGTMEALGTPQYMAPEQASGSSPADERSDVYSLGVILCEMLSGRLPFDGETNWAILTMKLSQDAPSLAVLRPGANPTLTQIVDTCLQRDPARRYATAGALATALDRVLPGPVSPVTPSHGAHRVAAPASGTGGSRSISPLAVLGGVGAALLLLLAFLYFSRPKVEPTSATLPPATTISAIATAVEPNEQAGAVAGNEAPTSQPPTSTPAVAADANASENSPAAAAPVAPQPVIVVPEEIIFQSNRDGDYDIYKMDTAGNNVQALIFNTSEDRYPRVSPDGRLIAYQSNRDGGRNEIYVMDRDGGNQQRLTFNSDDDRMPAWSPDSSQLVFSRMIGVDSELYIMDSDGRNEHQVTSSVEDEAHVSWSRDNRLIYNADQLGASYWQMYMINPDGSGYQQVTNSHYDEWSAEWSPDGRQILYISEQSSRTNPGIFLMNADGSNIHQIYDGPTMEWGAVWSPDGRQIAFAADQVPDDTADIYVMDATGGRPRFIMSHGGYPSWAPALTDLGGGVTVEPTTQGPSMIDDSMISAPVEPEVLDFEMGVDGTVERTYTGLKILRGQRVMIDYVDGRWRAGPLPTWPLVGPFGDAQVSSKPSLPVPNWPIMSLVVGVGNGIPLAVGNALDFISNDSDQLWLGPNDDNASDNGGQLIVRVRVFTP